MPAFPPNAALTFQVSTIPGERDRRGNLTPVVTEEIYQVFVNFSGSVSVGAETPASQTNRLSVQIYCCEPPVLSPSISNGQKGRIVITDPAGLQASLDDELLIEILPPSPWGLTADLGQELKGTLINHVSWSNG